VLGDLEGVTSLIKAFLEFTKMTMGRGSFMWSGSLVAIEGFLGKDGRKAFSGFVGGGMRRKLMKDGIDFSSKMRRHDTAFKDLFLLSKILAGLLFLGSELVQDVVSNR